MITYFLNYQAFSASPIQVHKLTVHHSNTAPSSSGSMARWWRCSDTKADHCLGRFWTSFSRLCIPLRLRHRRQIHSPKLQTMQYYDDEDHSDGAVVKRLSRMREGGVQIPVGDIILTIMLYVSGTNELRPS